MTGTILRLALSVPQQFGKWGICVRIFLAPILVLLLASEASAQLAGGDTLRAPAVRSIARYISDEAGHFVTNGILQEQIGDFRGAAESYRRALELMPESVELRLWYAENLYRMQNYGAAIENLRLITAERADVFELQATCLRATGQEDSSRSVLKRLLRVDPNNATAYSFLASTFRRLNQIDSVIWAYEHLARLNPDNFRLRMELGRLLADNNRPEGAKKWLRESLDRESGVVNLLSWTYLGELLEKEDSLPASLQAYRAARALDTTNIDIHRRLTTLYLTMDSLPLAADHAREAARLAPLERRLSRRLGAIYFSLDSVRLADSVFAWLLDSGERHPADLYYRGRIAVRRDSLDQALRYFTEVTRLADSIPESWLDIGAVHRRMGRSDLERTAYATGQGHVRADSQRVRLMFALGAAYEREDLIDSATTVFEELVALSPNHASALNYLGYMFADRGLNLSYAHDLIQRALAIEPDNAAYLDSFGWVYFRMGKYDRALDYLLKASTLANDPTIFDHLGDTYAALGKQEEARLSWQKSLELDPKNETVRRKLEP